MKAHKISEEQFVLDCINKEFSIANTGLQFETFDNLKDWAKDHENWYSNYSFTTEDQYKEWKNYFVTHFYDWQPKYIDKKTAEREFEWFSLNYGFKDEWYTNSTQD